MANAATDPLASFRLDGKVACITRGGAGIGAATARLMAAAGATVVILDRDAAAAAATAAAIGAGCQAQVLDVGSEPAIRTVMADIADRHGKIDIVVANAGINIRRTAAECSLEDWNAVVQINLTGVFLTARTAAEHMPETGGSVVSTASIMSFSGGFYPNISYMTTKGALVNLTRALAVEWAGRNIRVNAVAPTWTRTGFIQPLLDTAEIAAHSNPSPRCGVRLRSRSWQAPSSSWRATLPPWSRATRSRWRAAFWPNSDPFSGRCRRAHGLQLTAERRVGQGFVPLL